MQKSQQDEKSTEVKVGKLPCADLEKFARRSCTQNLDDKITVSRAVLATFGDERLAMIDKL